MQETHKLSDNLAALKEKIETGLEGPILRNCMSSEALILKEKRVRSAS
mgnify:CR=1 FL=1